MTRVVSAFESTPSKGGGSSANTEFHATVTSVSGSTVSYTLIYNEDTRGEKRLLINTTAAKDDSTGTITGISGTPPVVTGSGTKFSTNHGGTGSKTSLCFELNGSAGRLQFRLEPGARRVSGRLGRERHRDDPDLIL